MTIDLKTGIEYAPRREDHCTKFAGATEATGECPLWRTFLDRVTAGTDDLQKYLQRIAGYSLTGSIREHAMFFFYGTGANGKGVFINTLRGIWGDHAVVAPMEMFVETKFDRHPTELADLKGARLVIAQETERGRRWAESRIKSMTGGDPIKARYMRQDFFEFRPQFKLMIAGNHKPSLYGVDEAIRRRIHLIPFTVTIPEAERNPNLADELKVEWNGILRWAVDGCLEWQRIGLAPPEIVLSATREYLEGEDALGQWIGDRCEVGKEFKEAIGALYQSWCLWCEAAREPPGSQKAFSQALDAHGFERSKDTKVRSFIGIRLARTESTATAAEGIADLDRRSGNRKDRSGSTMTMRQCKWSEADVADPVYIDVPYVTRSRAGRR
jgi:putative DNA primase/helicase